MNKETLNPKHNSDLPKADQKSSKPQIKTEARPLIVVENLSKSFTVGRMKVDALADLSFVINKGEFVALQGVSGAGKSTLLHIIGGLERSTSGTISINGKELQKFSEDELTLFRKDNIGFVFQFFNLIPSLTALENVLVSHMFESTLENHETWTFATGLLEMMGLKHRLDHKPSELSGGEQQRVAIARALMNRPMLILADEPTGNIDSESSRKIMKMFRSLNKKGTTIILATHDDDIARTADRSIYVKDGKLLLLKSNFNRDQGSGVRGQGD
jgi:ABC-type lipoprotein export system ATPase subunit